MSRDQRLLQRYTSPDSFDDRDVFQCPGRAIDADWVCVLSRPLHNDLTSLPRQTKMTRSAAIHARPRINGHENGCFRTMIWVLFRCTTHDRPKALATDLCQVSTMLHGRRRLADVLLTARKFFKFLEVLPTYFDMCMSVRVCQ